jgi:hypothetical protein
LTIRSPDGPTNVARLEIVLANPDKIDSIQNQRVAPNSFTMSEEVRYYRERATAGSIEGVGAVDGFTIRIEPNIVEVPEKRFIPFLVAYDAQENVVGVGAVLDLDGEPSEITIEGGAARKYFVDMVGLVPMDPALGMGERQSLYVRCGDVPSGIAWRPGKAQLRLLLGQGSDDASERETDLDCDDHVAPDQDCDDLRSTFHRGQRDACDGQDANCDGARMVVEDCSVAGCTNGVQLCDDTTGEPSGTCVATSACGTQGAACSLPWRTTQNVTTRAPCAPGVGKMHFDGCTDGAACTIEVLSATAPWVGYIGAAETGPFSTKLANVTSGLAYLELKLAGTTDVMPSVSQGTLHLMITQAGQTRLVPVDITLAEANPVTQCPAIGGTNTFQMTCTP